MLRCDYTKGKSKDKDHIYIRSLLSILPLVDAYLFIAILHHLKNKMEKTRWIPIGRRISNFGLSLCWLGGVAVGLFSINDVVENVLEVEIVNIPFDNVNFYPLFLIGAVILAFTGKVITGQLQGMNEGTTPIIPGKESLTTGFLNLCLECSSSLP